VLKSDGQRRKCDKVNALDKFQKLCCSLEL
jgi:hypothetical protein